MPLQILTSLAATAGLGTAAIAAYYQLHRRERFATVALIIGSGLAAAVNFTYFSVTIGTAGILETFRHSFDATILLALMLTLMGMVTHLSTKLRGLDGFLFILAGVVEISGLLVMGQRGNDVAYRPWFVTHSFAFALSGACFLAAGAAGLAYLLMNRVLRRKRGSALLGFVAPLESLEQFGRWMLMVGFPLFTYGVLTGICELVRSRDPGPREWLRDPLIQLSFVTWLVYAALIVSMWVRPELRGRRAATWMTCGMGLVGIVFLVVEFISPLHR